MDKSVDNYVDSHSPKCRKTISGSGRTTEYPYETESLEDLLGKDDFLSVIQCGMFKGNTRAVFVDKREYTGRFGSKFSI